MNHTPDNAELERPTTNYSTEINIAGGESALL